MQITNTSSNWIDRTKR